LIDPELFCFFHTGLLENERCVLADASRLEDDGAMFYAIKIEIERAWRMITGETGSSADDKWQWEGY